MHFQIYIPGAKDLASELAGVGLGDFVRGSEVIREPEGPDGTGGAVFAWWGGANVRQIGYRPNDQKWVQSRCGKFWTGLWNADPLKPDECLIASHQGKRVRLGDGREWLIPAVDGAEKELVLVDGGRLGLRIPDKFDALMLEKYRWLERIHHTPTFTVDEELYEQILNTVLVALRLNYRMTREAALSMSLFSTSSLLASLNAAIGDVLAVSA